MATVNVAPATAMFPLVFTAFLHLTFVAKPALLSASTGAELPMACAPSVQVVRILTMRATCLGASLVPLENGQIKKV